MRNLLLGLVAASTLALGVVTAAPTARDIYTRNLPGVALVIGAEVGKDEYLVGTAFVVDAEKRLLITCHHVVRDAETVELLFPTLDGEGRLIAETERAVTQGVGSTARVLAVDARRDLALVQAESLPASVVGLLLAPREPSPGEELHQIGCPPASSALWVYSGGRVRQVYQRTWTAGGDGGWRKQLEARIVESYVPSNGGDSGAPVFNDLGQIVAMHQGRSLSGNALAYGISVEEIRTFLRTRTPRLAEPLRVAPTAVPVIARVGN